jgi:hypothetical protein
MSMTAGLSTPLTRRSGTLIATHVFRLCCLLRWGSRELRVARARLTSASLKRPDSSEPMPTLQVASCWEWWRRVADVRLNELGDEVCSALSDKHPGLRAQLEAFLLADSCLSQKKRARKMCGDLWCRRRAGSRVDAATHESGSRQVRKHQMRAQPGLQRCSSVAARASMQCCCTRLVSMRAIRLELRRALAARGWEW